MATVVFSTVVVILGLAFAGYIVPFTMAAARLPVSPALEAISPLYVEAPVLLTAQPPVKRTKEDKIPKLNAGQIPMGIVATPGPKATAPYVENILPSSMLSAPTATAAP